MIKQRTLGRTDLKVSELCLGTLNFGWKTDEATSFEIFDAFYAAGGNFIQGAAITPTFALPSASTAATEEVIGRWMASRRIPREKLVLGTRLSLHPSPGAGANLAQLTAQSVRASMQRLNTDYLDLLMFEWNERMLPTSEVLEAFDVALRQCFVRYVGASNFAAWRVADCISLAFQRNQPRMEALQADYSLMTRARFEPEAMSLCAEQRLGFIATSPLAGGFLTTRKRTAEATPLLRDRWAQRFRSIYGDVALSAVAEVAARHEASLAEVALAWVLQNPTVTSALVGVRSGAEMQELARASQLRLTPLDLRELTAATETEEVRIDSDLLTRVGVESVAAN